MFASQTTSKPTSVILASRVNGTCNRVLRLYSLMTPGGTNIWRAGDRPGGRTDDRRERCRNALSDAIILKTVEGVLTHIRFDATSLSSKALPLSSLPRSRSVPPCASATPKMSCALYELRLGAEMI